MNCEKNPNLTIKKASKNDANLIASLHTKFITTRTNSQPNIIEGQYLIHYYHELISRDDCLVLIAEVDRKVVGYASVVSNQGGILVNLALKHPILLFSSIKSNLTSLNYLFVKLKQKITHEVFGGKWKGGPTELRSGYELRSIAVLPEYRKVHVGTCLLNHIIQFCIDNDWFPIIAWVAIENIASQRLFEKVGFKRAQLVNEKQGQVYIYSYSLRAQGKI